MTRALAIVGLALAAWIAFATMTRHEPTDDERYGCTIEQADPATGECW